MSMRKRKVAEVITISECMDANSDDSDRPGWLPDGWETVCRWKKNNQDMISFYYPCPKCAGITLQTQDEVLRHCLFLCEDAPLKSKRFFQNEQEQKTLRHPRHINELLPVRDGQKLGSSKEGGHFGTGLFDSIPIDWIIEIRRGPGEYGKIYKFYVDPTKEYRFLSKEEVQFYLKEGKPLYPASTEKLYCDTTDEHNIIAEITYSPENLPDGWIKEMKYRHNYATSKNGIRKDPYYTDPESGTVFRSVKEVERYLQTGELPKQARKPQCSVTDIYSFESTEEMPEYLAKRLYLRKKGRPSKRAIDEGNNKVLMGPTDYALNTRDEFMEAGNDIVGPTGTIFTGEQDQRKEGDLQGFKEAIELSNVDRLTD